MPTPRTIKVFIASPGDLAVERRAFKDVLDELNGDFAQGARVRFEPLAWEETVSPVGRRPQSEFNKEVEKCDVFILAMYRKWGQKAPDITPPATCYTEEEFNVAMARLARTQTGPIIHVLFKDIDAEFLKDPGPQLKKVLNFKKKLERSGKAISIRFADEAAFRSKLFELLKDSAHRIADGVGEVALSAALHIRPEPVPLPAEQLEELRKELARSISEREKLEAELLKLKKHGKPETPKSKALRKSQTERTQTRLSSAKREQAALRLAERAAKAALEGRVEEARQDFAKATEGTANLRVLYLAFEFYDRTGDLAMAEELVERRLAICGKDAENADTARAWGNLGLIYETRGDLDRAEEMQLKALQIDEKLDNQEGIARHRGNLGLIYQKRGDLDRAEEMQLKSLAIEVKLGRPEGMAADYGNLGLIYLRRGDLGLAEEMFKKGLSIQQSLGLQEGVAAKYGNLGLIYRRRGDLDRAEEMHLASLAIEEKLGRREGMAASYSNLGLIHEMRGDLARAEEMHRQALAIHENLARKEGIAAACGNLGLIYGARGDLDRAEEMHRKALAIHESLGRQEGMAANYGNLGSVEEDRGNFDRARELWTKARNLFAKIGMPQMVKNAQEWLDGLP